MSVHSPNDIYFEEFNFIFTGIHYVDKFVSYNALKYIQKDV